MSRITNRRAINRRHHSTISGVCIGAVSAVAMFAGSASGGERLIATVSASDFEVDGSGTVITVDFDVDKPVTGVGLTGLWTALIADEQNGNAPWSLDLTVVVTAPDGTSQIVWAPIGGDATIADFPFDDFTTGFDSIDGTGTFTWSFKSIGPPWLAGLSDVEFHLTTQEQAVVQEFTGSVKEGPLWDRPYSINGISGLGPVVYDVLEFEVSVSGGYEIESVVPRGNNFAFLYRGAFDPEKPLDNLLDYGLGNGFSPDGTPQGTSLINAMLFEQTRYYLVVSQWSATQPGQPYTNTVVGPGEFITFNDTTPGDLNGDGEVNVLDLLIMLESWGDCESDADCPADLNDDGTVNVLDLLVLLENWG